MTHIEVEGRPDIRHVRQFVTAMRAKTAAAAVGFASVYAPSHESVTPERHAMPDSTPRRD
jgi:hypothetical protein